jgi:hypothetical protein
MLNNFTDIKNKIINVYLLDNLINSTFHNKFNGDKQKINKYILNEGCKRLNSKYSKISIKEYAIYDNIIPSNTFIVLKSKLAMNHPFVIFANYHTNYIKLYLSYGKDNYLGQIDLDLFEILLNEKYNKLLTKDDYYSLYIMFIDSIYTRKNELINNDKFSLLKCNNIKQCIITTRTIKKNNKLSIIQKKNLIIEKELYYKKKAINVLEKFFTMLDKAQFEEAYKFLKVNKIKKGTHKGKIINKTEYFGKQRLDTFFKSNKKIIGHLQIFIDIYQFIHLLKLRL